MGTEEQKAKFLPMCVSTEDEVKIGAYGLTEPEAGSDVANISTTAVRDGDFYVLNGTKRFITNGGIADVTVVFATEDKSKGWGGFCAFAIEKGTPGLIEGTVWKKMGVRASHTSDVVLDDCRVPLDHRLGDPPGAGPRKANHRVERSAPWAPWSAPAHSSVPSPWGSAAPLSSTPLTTPRSTSSSASPSRPDRPSPSSWQTWPSRWTPPA